MNASGPRSAACDGQTELATSHTSVLTGSSRMPMTQHFTVTTAQCGGASRSVAAQPTALHCAIHIALVGRLQVADRY